MDPLKKYGPPEGDLMYRIIADLLKRPHAFEPFEALATLHFYKFEGTDFEDAFASFDHNVLRYLRLRNYTSARSADVSHGTAPLAASTILRITSPEQASVANTAVAISTEPSPIVIHDQVETVTVGGNTHALDRNAQADEDDHNDETTTAIQPVDATTSSRQEAPLQPRSHSERLMTSTTLPIQKRKGAPDVSALTNNKRARLTIPSTEPGFAPLIQTSNGRPQLIVKLSYKPRIALSKETPVPTKDNAQSTIVDRSDTDAQHSTDIPKRGTDWSLDESRSRFTYVGSRNMMRDIRRTAAADKPRRGSAGVDYYKRVVLRRETSPRSSMEHLPPCTRLSLPATLSTPAATSSPTLTTPRSPIDSDGQASVAEALPSAAEDENHTSTTSPTDLLLAKSSVIALATPASLASRPPSAAQDGRQFSPTTAYLDILRAVTPGVPSVQPTTDTTLLQATPDTRPVQSTAHTDVATTPGTFTAQHSSTTPQPVTSLPQIILTSADTPSYSPRDLRTRSYAATSEKHSIIVAHNHRDYRITESITFGDILDTIVNTSQEQHITDLFTKLFTPTHNLAKTIHNMLEPSATTKDLILHQQLKEAHLSLLSNFIGDPNGSFTQYPRNRYHSLLTRIIVNGIRDRRHNNQFVKGHGGIDGVLRYVIGGTGLTWFLQGVPAVVLIAKTFGLGAIGVISAKISWKTINDIDISELTSALDGVLEKYPELKTIFRPMEKIRRDIPMVLRYDKTMVLQHFFEEALSVRM
ncbi:hypothetical protein AMS68_006882 [Peltaster fructicola]|uniref:Uncharacterized protein n=1 Tax=Peltaster fructicola TaxID=286661 RepID=A0A6H0Y362_9PEZI|nr:hypothetical protein AMS68_006882 [Peltaster fructicola]